MLAKNDFKKLVELGTLFAFDLIIKNKNGDVLLGKRTNSPAKGFWFVPGGRVFKNETLSQGIRRVSKSEIGIEIGQKDIIPLGIYEHIYKDNFFDDKNFGTHYIILACHVIKKINAINFKSEQHCHYEFFPVERLLKSKVVHQFIKNYFIDSPDNMFLKFKITN